MVVRVATDERSLETPSSEESGFGRNCDSSDDTETEAALVVPPDGGWGWVVVAASFMCNVLVDGIIMSGSQLLIGIQKEFNVTDGQAAPVNSLLSGFYLMAGPFVSALANKYGFRMVTIIGSIISSAAFMVSYHATCVEYLYLSYGVIGGIGFCMIYMPAVLTVGFYFEKWRALATGLALCGSGVGTFIFAPLTEMLVKELGWRKTMFVHAVIVLFCIICGALFRPIKPTRVTRADQPEEDTSRRHEEAVEKLNSMLKLQTKLDSGISMPSDMHYSNRVSPHTWMGVANNTTYPTAAEIFRGSNSHLSRRSSANASTIKNHLGNKPLFIAVPVVEKDEQDESNNSIDNTEPLITPISSPIKIQPREARPRRSHADLVARPLYRDDIFFGASLSRLPQYTSRTSLGYHLAVTHVPTQEDTQEEKTCRLCPQAVKRTLATMLDVSLFRSPTFIIFAVSGFFTMLSYFVPFMYLQKRAESNVVSQSSSSMLIPAIGIANIVGRIACGLASSVPKISTLWLNNIALTAGGVATILSGLYYHDAYQFGFCIVFGLAIACFASLRSILVVEYIGLEQLTNCFGLFLLFQGAGAMLGAPIAGYLMDVFKSYDLAFGVSGGFMLLSALMCYPVDCVSRWEKARNKLSSSPKV